MSLPVAQPDQIIRYLTHPQVHIDPAKDVRDWSLDETGAARVAALARSGGLAGTTRIISSTETKAVETAQPLADALGCGLELHPLMHENDRSATGFLPGPEFEATADLVFVHPETSIRGWETARAAQDRIVGAVRDCLKQEPGGDVLFVGHGAVGTLLYCHLSGLGISRAHDQGPGGGGNYFAFTRSNPVPRTHWQPLEHLIDRQGHTDDNP